MPSIDASDVVALADAVSLSDPTWGATISQRLKDLSSKVRHGVLSVAHDLTVVGTALPILTSPASTSLLVTEVLVFRRGTALGGNVYTIGRDSPYTDWHDGIVTTLLVSDSSPLLVRPRPGADPFTATPPQLVPIDGGQSLSVVRSSGSATPPLTFVTIGAVLQR